MKKTLQEEKQRILEISRKLNEIDIASITGEPRDKNGNVNPQKYNEDIPDIFKSDKSKLFHRFIETANELKSMGVSTHELILFLQEDNLPEDENDSTDEHTWDNKDLYPPKPNDYSRNSFK